MLRPKQLMPAYGLVSVGSFTECMFSWENVKGYLNRKYAVYANVVLRCVCSVSRKQSVVVLNFFCLFLKLFVVFRSSRAYVVALLLLLFSR
jgi:hypothetical protein